MVSQKTTFPNFEETTSSPGSPLADLAVNVARGRGSSTDEAGNGNLKFMTSLDEGVDALELKGQIKASECVRARAYPYSGDITHEYGISG